MEKRPRNVLLAGREGNGPRPCSWKGARHPDAPAAEVDRQADVLAEDLALHRRVQSTGLPLSLRDEPHLPADRLGTALRRALAGFAVAVRDGLRATT